MDKKAILDLSFAFIIKAILMVITLIIIISFFSDAIFLSGMDVVGKIVLLLAIITIYGNLTYMLMKLGMGGL